MIYLDNAATSGVKPPSVIAAVTSALKYFSANPGRSGYKTSLKASEKIYMAREKAARFFGADAAENVAFTLNCTQAINCILKGILSSGDHIIISGLEHNAVMRPLYTLAQHRSIEISVAEISPNDDITVSNFEKLIKGNTRLIFSTHSSNVTGQIMPIEKIGAMAKKHGISFAVDAAQTAGVIKIDMQKMNIDYLAVAAHKGLLAPMGTGLLIARKPLKYTVLEGGTGSNSIDAAQPEDMPERQESGTVNLPGIFGVSAGLDFVSAYGTDNLYLHELQLIDNLYKRFEKMDKVILYTPRPELYRTAPVLPFNIKNKSCDDVASYLASHNVAVRAGLHCAPTVHKIMGTLPHGCVRISTGYFNNRAEIDSLVELIKKI